MYADVVWADAVTANAKGRSTDNFIVRKFRKKNLRDRDICDTSAEDAKDRILTGYPAIERCNGPHTDIRRWSYTRAEYKLSISGMNIYLREKLTGNTISVMVQYPAADKCDPDRLYESELNGLGVPGMCQLIIQILKSKVTNSNS